MIPRQVHIFLCTTYRPKVTRRGGQWYCLVDIIHNTYLCYKRPGTWGGGGGEGGRLLLKGPRHRGRKRPKHSFSSFEIYSRMGKECQNFSNKYKKEVLFFVTKILCSPRAWTMLQVWEKNNVFLFNLFKFFSSVNLFFKLLVIKNLSLNQNTDS